MLDGHSQSAKESLLMSTKPHIAIVGAGPGGLTLARILHLRGITSTLFERDTHALVRQQGGTLDLDSASGQFALEQAGLMAEFRHHARYEDQGIRLLDKHAHVHFDDPGDAADDRPEIDRTQLRDLLLSSLPQDFVRWGHELQEVRPSEHGTYDLVFENTTAGPFDLVVGADGAWSRVRPLVSSYVPQYTGVTVIEFGIDDIDARYPSLSQLVGHGNFAAYGDAKSLMAQRNANAHVRVYAAMRMPEGWAAQHFNVTNPREVREQILDLYSDWAPELKDLIQRSNDRIRPLQLYALPVGHCWTNRTGITLLGDAAHLMSPHGGSGVNNAMKDAAELGRLLSESDDWREAVRIYESEMFERVLDSAREASHGIATALSHMQLEIAVGEMQAIRG
jgi:2-polyprenyl-6-methoxyphenol hydroxylase-like FAD-dependent oxidoreductase